MATTARKAPQDHKKPKEEIYEDLQRDFNEVEGSELIKPLSKIKGSDQLRIMGRLVELGITDEGADESEIDFEKFADLVDWISERFSVDSKKFDEWSGGTGGMTRTLTLAMALMGELGKGMSSADS